MFNSCFIEEEEVEHHQEDIPSTSTGMCTSCF